MIAVKVSQISLSNMGFVIFLKEEPEAVARKVRKARQFAFHYCRIFRKIHLLELNWPMKIFGHWSKLLVIT